MENLCHFGCGQPGLFAHAKTGVLRCSKNVSNCPIIMARKAEKQAPKSAQIIVRKQEIRKNRVPELCICGQMGTYFSERTNKWRCVPHKTKGPKCPAEQEKFEATMKAKYGTTDMSKIEGVQERRSIILREQHALRSEEEVRATVIKRQNTTEKRYGTKVYLSLPEAQEKLREQNLERYGVEHSLQRKDVREKGKQTMLSTLGYDHPLKSPEIKEALRKTNVAKYGVVSPMQNSSVMIKTRATNFARYGAESIMHNVEIAERTFKAGKKIKDVVLESGRIYKVQGYEPFAINYLLSIGYVETDLGINYYEKPVVSWRDSDSKIRKYYPDIFLKFENHIIEVKSEWSMNHTEWHSMNLAKQKYSVKAGFKFTFLIFDGKGNILQQIGDKLAKQI